LTLRTGKEQAEVNATLAWFGRVLGIVYRAIATHLIKKAGLTWATAETGAVTLIQRFGSALNLKTGKGTLPFIPAFSRSPARPVLQYSPC
jgi:hypothetical protein